MNASFELSNDIPFGILINKFSFHMMASHSTSCPSKSCIFNVSLIACCRDCLVSSPIEGGALYLPKTLLSDNDIDETRFAEITALWGTSGAPLRPRTQRNTIVTKRSDTELWRVTTHDWWHCCKRLINCLTIQINVTIHTVI